LTDICQIEPDKILVVALNTFLRQSLATPSITMGLDRSGPCRAFALNCAACVVPGAQGLQKHCTGRVKMPKQQGFCRKQPQTIVRGCDRILPHFRPGGASVGPTAPAAGQAGEGPGPG